MSEVLTYATPQQPPPTATTVAIIGLEMYFRPTPLVRIILQEDGPDGRTFDAYYHEDEGALELLQALIKANLSTKSLHKRIIERLLVDGKLSDGTITGNPD